MTSLMTTHPEQPVRRRSSTPSRHSQRAGADAFLVKPLDAAELIAEVMEARDAPPEPGTV